MSYRPNRRQGINPVWILIGVNVVIFLATLVDSQDLIFQRFALIPSQVPQQPWTLLTYMFLHGSFTHIIFNMLTLYFFGTFTMALLGETNFLTTYFAGGIMGGIFYYLFSFLPIDYFQVTQYSAVVGASGAIYALGGVLAVMRPNVKVVVFPLPMQIPLWIAVVVGFLIVAFLPSVAWQAHLGGLVYGLVVGYYFRRREIRRY